MARKRANMSDLLNDLTYTTLYNKFRLLAVNAFQWDGLPPGILERHIERELFDHGKAIFFRDPDQSYMCLKAQEGFDVNFYGDPLYYRAIGIGYNKQYNKDDCVIIENTKLRTPTRDYVMFYTNKLTEAERTMDVNVKAVKTPVILKCDDKDAFTFKAIFNKVDGNVPAIYADRNLNIDSIQALDLKAKFLGNELMDYKKAVEAELLTFLGINNPAVEKRERVIVDEANSNNQLIESFAEIQLEARKRACEEINSMFGLNVTVKRRDNVHNSVESVENRGGAES